MFKSLMTKKNNPFISWQKEMNHMFDKFNREFDLPTMSAQEFCPKVEMKDIGNGYTLKAEVPGLSEKDIHVSLKDNHLILEGERKTELKKEDKGQYFSEFTYGSFYRSIPLDEEVNAEKVRADYKDGILTIELEKSEAGKKTTRQIPINKA